MTWKKAALKDTECYPSFSSNEIFKLKLSPLPKIPYQLHHTARLVPDYVPCWSKPWPAVWQLDHYGLTSWLWSTLVAIFRPDSNLAQLSSLILGLPHHHRLLCGSGLSWAGYHHHSWSACFTQVLQDRASAGDATASTHHVTISDSCLFFLWELSTLAVPNREHILFKIIHILLNKEKQ